MPRLVEGAGKPLFAGWLSRYHGLTACTCGARRIRHCRPPATLGMFGSKV